MLNPDLKLNEKLFDENVEQKATRDGFGEALVILGEKNPNVDLVIKIGREAFVKDFISYLSD